MGRAARTRCRQVLTFWILCKERFKDKHAGITRVRDIEEKVRYAERWFAGSDGQREGRGGVMDVRGCGKGRMFERKHDYYVVSAARCT